MVKHDKEILKELEDLRAYKTLSEFLCRQRGYTGLSELIESASRAKSYTKGVLKIFIPNKYISVEETASYARDLGFDLFEHDDVIYYIGDRKNDKGKYVINNPIATSLLIDDFEF